MDCCSRINHGFHVACHVVRTTVDVQRECGDPFVIPEMTCPSSAITHTHGCQHRRCSVDHLSHCSNAVFAIFGKMPTQCHKQNTFHLACCRLSSEVHCVWALGPLPFTFPLGCPLPLSHLPCPLPFPLPLGWPLPSFTSPVSNVPPDSHDFLDRT